MEKEKLIKVCEQVMFDVENDAKVFDGQPFTGKVIATYFGNQGAAINALANVLKEILQNDKNGI